MTTACQIDRESNPESGLSDKIQLIPDNLIFNPGFLLELLKLNIHRRSLDLSQVHFPIFDPVDGQRSKLIMPGIKKDGLGHQNWAVKNI